MSKRTANDPWETSSEEEEVEEEEVKEDTQSHSSQTKTYKNPPDKRRRMAELKRAQRAEGTVHNMIHKRVAKLRQKPSRLESFFLAYKLVGSPVHST
jgi:hypothetical protein